MTERKKKLLENFIRREVRKSLNERMGAQLSTVMMSHLSDISATSSENRKKAEFVKYLIMKYVPKKEIDPDQEWSEYLEKYG